MGTTVTHLEAADNQEEVAEAHPAVADPAEMVEAATKIATTVATAQTATSYEKCASEINSFTKDIWKCWILSQASRTLTVAEGDPEKSPRHLWLGIQQ